jgi:hypothetical protein
MGEQWDYQIRFYLTEEAADIARADPDNVAIRPIREILDRHGATMKSQFDAFAEYVAEAEREGVEGFPLYKWTRLTIDDPAKRAKHIKSFAIHVDGSPVYAKPVADALEADLRPLEGGALITGLSRHDTNPANNMPVPAHLR